MPREPGAVAAGRVEHLADLAQRGDQIGAGVEQFQVLNFLADRFGFHHWCGHDHAGRTGHLHQRKTVARRALLHDPRGPLLGLLEARVAICRVGHGIGRIDHQHAEGAAVEGYEDRQGRRVPGRAGPRRSRGSRSPACGAAARAIARCGSAASAASPPPGGSPSPPRPSRGISAG